jgi:salicylate hydroxylase
LAGSSLAVVGAGIGGLTAALALARQGHAITLLERRTGFSEIGAGLQLSPNASRILLDLGLGPALQRVATEPDRVVIRAIRSATTIGEIALGPFMRERFGAPYWVVHRADLQQVLLDAVRSQASIRMLMGRTVEDVRSDPASAVLTFSNESGGRDTLAVDGVIGADGVWSKVRSGLRIRSPVFKGYLAWRATVDRTKIPLQLSANETGLWLGPHGHVVHYPIAGGSLLNVVVIARDSHPVDGWAAAGRRIKLLARYNGAATVLRELLAVPQEWTLWSLFDASAERLAEGRIAVLGDAAHPVLPFLAQGAALAIEDAACLARSLQQTGTPERAFEAYQAQRLARVRQVQRHARRNGLVYHLGGPAALARNLVLRRLGPTGMTMRYEWLYGFQLPGSVEAAQRA